MKYRFLIIALTSLSILNTACKKSFCWNCLMHTRSKAYGKQEVKTERTVICDKTQKEIDLYREGISRTFTNGETTVEISVACNKDN